VGDIRATLPRGVIGPFFNDEFGDTFGNICTSRRGLPTRS
jgi:multidrug efflux pump